MGDVKEIYNSINCSEHLFQTLDISSFTNYFSPVYSRCLLINRNRTGADRIPGMPAAARIRVAAKKSLPVVSDGRAEIFFFSGAVMAIEPVIGTSVKTVLSAKQPD